MEGLDKAMESCCGTMAANMKAIESLVGLLDLENLFTNQAKGIQGIENLIL